MNYLEFENLDRSRKIKKYFPSNVIVKSTLEYNENIPEDSIAFVEDSPLVDASNLNKDVIWINPELQNNNEILAHEYEHIILNNTPVSNRINRLSNRANTLLDKYRINQNLHLYNLALNLMDKSDKVFNNQNKILDKVFLTNSDDYGNNYKEKESTLALMRYYLANNTGLTGRNLNLYIRQNKENSLDWLNNLSGGYKEEFSSGWNPNYDDRIISDLKYNRLVNRDINLQNNRLKEH